MNGPVRKFLIERHVHDIDREMQMKGEQRLSQAKRILDKLTQEQRAELQKKALEDRERLRQERERKQWERK